MIFIKKRNAMKSVPIRDMSQFDVINIQTNVNQNILGTERRCLFCTDGIAYFSIWDFQGLVPKFFFFNKKDAEGYLKVCEF